MKKLFVYINVTFRVDPKPEKIVCTKIQKKEIVSTKMHEKKVVCRKKITPPPPPGAYLGGGLRGLQLPPWAADFDKF